MESGRRFRGRVFIDATYEGDLMAKAGVQYLVGRESNAAFGETHNGNQPHLLRRQKVASAHDFRRAVDVVLDVLIRILLAHLNLPRMD